MMMDRAGSSTQPDKLKCSLKIEVVSMSNDDGDMYMPMMR